MSEQRNVTITVDLSEEEAWQLAQFFKRATFDDFSMKAESEELAYTMLYASERVRDALAEKGYAPR